MISDQMEARPEDRKDEIRAMREHGKVMIDRSSLEAFHNSGKRP